MDWDQAKAILWLRWRLAANQLRKAGPLNSVIALLGTTAAAGLAVLSFLGGFAAGAFLLARAGSQVLLWAWDGFSLIFLFCWAIGLLAELQRSETIDLPRLMHLPVSIRQAFIFNYLASHFSLSFMIFLPGALGTIAGLMLYEKPVMGLLVLPVIGLFLAVTAWSYCLRGWLSSLMVNQRKRRGILTAATMTLVLVTQLPNLMVNAWLRPQTTGLHHSAPLLSPAVLRAHEFVPPLWPGYAAMNLAHGNVYPALIFAVITALLAGLGLLRAYRSTLGLYLGKASGGPVPVRPAAAAAPVSGKSRLLERELPFIPDEAAAIALASFRSMSRAPEVKIAIVSSVFLLFIFGGTMFSNAQMKSGGGTTSFLTIALMTFPFMTALQLFNNQFGYDRDGFRLFLLVPASARNILLGRNLSLLPVVLLIGLLPLAVQIIIFHASPDRLAATVFQLACLFFVLGILGNIFSITAPYRVNQGSVRATKMSPAIMLASIGGTLLFLVVAVPVLAVPALVEAWCRHSRWLRGVPLALLLSVVLTLLLGLCYRSSLNPLARLFERRGKTILLAVTRETE